MFRSAYHALEDEPEQQQRHGGFQWAGLSLEDAAARRIQQMYKRNLVLFLRLGPMLFARRGSRKALHGEIYFAEADRTAKFIAVSDTTSVPLLCRFVNCSAWKLERPDVIISVTGAANTLDTMHDTRLHRVFDEGIVSAATSASCWITSGGTDSGVMKLVADACQKHQVAVPLIGFAPYARIHGREHIERTSSAALGRSARRLWKEREAPLSGARAALGV